MDELLKTLADHYIKSEYDKGIDLLLKNKDKFDTGLFHYNLGTFYLKKNDYAIARFHLEKSMKLGYINPSLYNNLNHAQQKLNVAQIEKNDFSFESILYRFLDYPSSLYLNAALVFTILILLLQKFKIIESKIKVLIIILISFLPFIFSIYSQKNFQYAIILKPSTVREGPSNIFPKTREVSAGIKVIIGKTVDGWSFIKFPLETVGWIERNELGIY